MRRSLTRAERLKRTSDFDRVFDKGRRFKGHGSRLIVYPNGLEHNRFAACPVRKYGTAVERNRAKRICKEAYRQQKDRIDTGYDIIMVIYPGSDALCQRTGQFLSLCERAGIRREPAASGS